MRKARSGLVVLFLVWGAGTLPADEPEERRARVPLVLEQATEAVLEAFRSDARRTLVDLAVKDDPDPWLVADELCARREHGAAVAYARAAPRPETKELARYVEDRTGKEDGESARTAVERFNAAVTEGNLAAAEVALREVELGGEDVASVRIAYPWSILHHLQNRQGESAVAARIAARMAERLGWWTRARQAWSYGAAAARDAHETALAVELTRGWLAVERRLGDASWISFALEHLARDLAAQGDMGGARRTYGEALEALVELREIAQGTPRMVRVLAKEFSLLLAASSAAAHLAEFADALDLLDRAEERSDRLQAPPVRAALLRERARLLWGLGRYEDCIRTAEEALALCRTARLTEEEDALRTILAAALGRNGDMPEAIRLLETSLGRAEAQEDASRIAPALTLLAFAHLEAGDPGRSLLCLERAFPLVERTGSPFNLATHHAHAGRAQLALGNLERAVEAAANARAEVIRRIRREARTAADLVHPKPDRLEDIRTRLEEDEVLVLYDLSDEEALALVVDRRGARRVRLASPGEIFAACDGLLSDHEPWIREEGVGPLRALLVDPLALGDPNYAGLAEGGEASPYRGSARGRLAPLPATRDEVAAIGTDTLLGAAATESALPGALGRRTRWRAVHFACHGLVDPDQPLLSSLALTPDAENDGFLTSLETFGLKIPADLVVLSACEMGKGRIYRAEGMVGLTRAFMFAGAPRVLCSLWNVDDEATRALMVKFYELWNPEEGEGLGAAAALRRAQEFVRGHEEWRHPYYWAAWVLWGLPS